MSSSGSSSEFRLVLVKVSDSLTEENVKRLAFLCENITPSKREKLTTGLELFSEMQGHDLLGEESVDLLVKWLDDLSLSNASEQLKKYKENYIDSGIISQGKCLIHDDLPLRYFCVSCDIKICPECAFKSHGRDTMCDVIHLNKLREEIDTRRKDLLTELDEVVTAARNAEHLWQQEKALFTKSCSAARTKALEDYVTSMEHCEKEKRTVLERLHNDELSNLSQQLERGKQIGSLKFDVQSLRESHQGASATDLQELQRINEAAKEIDKIKVRVKKQQETAKKKADETVHPKAKLVGSVMLGENTLISVCDERRVTGCVRLESAYPRGQDRWRLSVKVADHLSPVVLSYVDMWTNDRHNGLFAVGNTVFIVHPTRSSVTYLEIDEVPAGSWITSITALSVSRKTPSEIFLISCHNSNVILAFSLAGKPLDRVEISEKGLLNGISCMAYLRNIAAVIGKGCKQVTLVSVGGSEKDCGYLKPPSLGLIPTIVLPVGICWLVLYTGSGSDRRWKIMIYSRNGERMEEVQSGTSSSDIDTPIGIGRWAAKGYTIFANHEMPVVDFKLPSAIRTEVV